MADEEADVTGILCLEDSKRILTVGWNRRLVTYDDSHPEETRVKPNTVWKGGQVRQAQYRLEEGAGEESLTPQYG